MDNNNINCGTNNTTGIAKEKVKTLTNCIDDLVSTTASLDKLKIEALNLADKFYRPLYKGNIEPCCDSECGEQIKYYVQDERSFIEILSSITETQNETIAAISNTLYMMMTKL